LNIREFNSSKLLILLSSVSILFLSIIVLSFYSTDLKKIISFYEIRRHQNNNNILQDKINTQKNKIDLLINEINSLKNRDENLRKLLRMPSINEDTRKLGIGGKDTLIKNFNDLNYLLPSKINLNDLPKNLAFVERSINLEKLSYKEIEMKLESNLDYYLHFPAIYPVSVEEAKRTSRYGQRLDPFTKTRRFHEGDDFSGKIGVTVIATADGIVKNSRKYGSFGNYIEIDHGNGYVTAYGHLSKRKVKKGEKIVRGQKIGEIGNTGRSTAPHLHYEVQYKNKHTNPNKFYFDITT
jgi:murein DD-endopeptidase MepM/ murein hydrolase activator NlpD